MVAELMFFNGTQKTISHLVSICRLPEITSNAFAPDVLHPPDEACGSARRGMGRINIGIPRTAYLHVVTEPRLRGGVSPLDVSVIRLVRFQPQKGGLEFRDVNFE